MTTFTPEQVRLVLDAMRYVQMHDGFAGISDAEHIVSMLDQFAALLESTARMREWAEADTPKAHTYTSENADLYRGWENGMNSAKARVLALLPAPPTPDAPHEAP